MGCLGIAVRFSFRMRRTCLLRLTKMALAALMSRGLICGQELSFGFAGGTNLTRDFPISRTVFQDPSRPSGLTTFDLFSDTHSLIAGLSVEIRIGSGLSLEGNALHRKLHLRRRYIFPDYLQNTPVARPIKSAASPPFSSQATAGSERAANPILRKSRILRSSPISELAFQGPSGAPRTNRPPAFTASEDAGICDARRLAHAR